MNDQSKKIIIIAGGRQQGKTEKMRKLAEEAISKEKLIILSNTPSIVTKDIDE